MTRTSVLIALAGVALTFGVTPAGATNECRGLTVCVPVAGPWVIVPTGSRVPRPRVEYQLTCPRRYVVGGLDAELSHRGIDIAFLGKLGSPVNPGITTSRAAVFVATHVTGPARAPSFRPHIGCMPASGGGTRVPTSAAVVPPGQPALRRVLTARVRPGSRRVTKGCLAGERLVAASHAFGFFTSRPPSESLATSVTGTEQVRGRQLTVSVRADAELADVRVVVQLHALCARRQ